MSIEISEVRTTDTDITRERVRIIQCDSRDATEKISVCKMKNQK